MSTEREKRIRALQEMLLAPKKQLSWEAVEESISEAIELLKEETHIDRSKFDSCEFCKEIDDPCMIDQCFRVNRSKCRYSNCDKYLAFKEKKKLLADSNYCPKCGRPLNEAAWKELERKF